MIFGIKPEVNKKRRVSKPSEKPKAVYDLLNSVGAINDLNGTHGTEFTSEWVKDKDKWRKFFNKNIAYLVMLKELVESDKYNPDAIISANITWAHNKPSEPIGRLVSVKGVFGDIHDTSGVSHIKFYPVEVPNGLPKFDGPTLIFDPVIADEVGQSNKAFDEDVEHKGPIMFADDYIKQCEAKKDGGDLEIIQDPKFNTPEAQQKFVDAFNKGITE